MKTLLRVVLLGTTVCSCALAQQSRPVSDEDMRVVHFEKMYYPPTAQAISKEGLVVVNLKLDMDGNVVDAEALSGSVPLVRDSLDNSRKWRFKPNSQKAAVLVYNYRIVGMCLDNTEPAQFKLDQPNFVSVTGCAKRNVD